MTIKIQSKSQYAFAIFLAGSVCGLTHNMQANDDKTPADQVETTTHRLQITGATQQILAAIDDAVEVLNGVDYPAGTVIVGGTSYTANTNDLTSLSLGIAAVEGASFAASASLAALAGLDVPAGTVIVGGTTYTANTNDLTSISRALGAIEGTSGNNISVGLPLNFTTALAGLMTIALQVAVGQVIAAESNPAVTCTVTGATNATSFNTAMATVFTTITTAMTTPNNTNILAIITAINAAQLVVINTGTITSPYSYQAITAGLQSLEVAVNSWLAFYPTPPLA